MHVSDLMTRDVSCCSPDDSLSVAARLMWECDCGSVPVLESGTGRVIAMITDRDICMSTMLQDRPPSAIRVREAMSHQLHSCSPDDSIGQAESILRGEQIRRLPVVDYDGRLVGILSLADILRAASDGHRRELSSEEITETLSGISQPRPENRPENRPQQLLI